MNGMLALSLVIIIFAIGDFLSIRSKSLVSTMLISMLLLLFGFWTKLPKTLFEDAGLLKIGGLLIPFLIIHMGTLLNLEDLKREWRSSLIALGAVAGIAISLIFIGVPLIGKEYAISAAPPISGGIVAAIIMGERASQLGLADIGIFTTLILVVQQFFGIPLASLLLNHEAKNFIKENKDLNVSLDLQVHSEKTTERKKIFSPLPKHLQTPYILMAKIGLVVILSVMISDLSNGKLNLFIVSLFLGVILKELGFLEEGIMQRANTFGMGMITLMAVMFANLSQASPQVLLGMIKPLVGSLLIAIAGIVIVSLVLAKLFNYSKSMGIAIGLSALFGFPGTFILPSEIANAVGKNKEERELILSHLLPKMLVAGFVTVTMASVVLAGIMVKML